VAWALGCAVLLKADFQPARWKYRRTLAADPNAQILAFNMERGVYVHARADLGDLRLVHGEDEIPYVLEKMTGLHRYEELSTGLVDQGVTPPGDLEVTVDVGEGHRHNGIRLSTPKTNFRQRVAIETSDDRRRWTRARDDGSIFDFSDDGRRISLLYVGYPKYRKRDYGRS